MKLILLIAIALTATTNLFGATAAKAEVVIVASTSPGHATGTILGDKTELVLPAKTKITVMAQSGKYRVITGPFSGVHGLDAPENVNSRGLTVLASLVRTTVRDTSTVGAIRNVPGGGKPSFAIDWRTAGTHCVTADEEAQLWRPRKRGSQTASIVDTEGSSRADVMWAAGSHLSSWPKSVTRRDQATYKIGRKGSSFAKDITLRILPVSAKTPADRAIWMAENKCEKQARRYLASLK